MKQIIISAIVIVICITSSNQCAYATGKNEENSTESTSWVKDAFSAASSFLDEQPTDDLGIINPIFEKFKSIIKAANTVLMVLLIGLSIIALSITGVRYIASGAAPNQKEVAKHSLHTIFIGMAIGFGSYVIWRIAMSLVEIIIDSFAK